MKKLTIVGPTTGVVTGQSVITRRAAQVLSENRPTSIVNTNSEGLPRYRRTFRNISSIARILWARIGSDTLYISLHRSPAGSVKDLCAIAVFSIGKPACRIIAHLHGAEFDSFLTSLPSMIRPLYLWMYRKIQTWIIVAPGMAEQLVKIKGAHAEVLWNFSEPATVVGKIQETARTTLNVLFLSNIMRDKGALALCQAVHENPRTREGLTIMLSLAGNPLDKGSVAEMERVISNSLRMKYHGPVNGDKKKELLQWADVVILPSSYPSEALPLCLIEGAAHGCHLVSTYVGYIGDLVGMLIISELPSASVADIGRCLINLELDAVHETGLENERLARLYFSSEYFDRELIRIVNDFH